MLHTFGQPRSCTHVAIANARAWIHDLIDGRAAQPRRRKTPRTERGCQPVEVIIVAMVAPLGRLSSFSTRACFEPAQASLLRSWRFPPPQLKRPFKGIFCDDISEFKSSHPSQPVRSLSDIRFAEIRAPQMLVGQKGEEALDLINPALCSTRSAISVLAVGAKINVARAGGREHPAAAARGLSIYGSRCPPISSHG